MGRGFPNSSCPVCTHTHSFVFNALGCCKNGPALIAGDLNLNAAEGEAATALERAGFRDGVGLPDVRTRPGRGMFDQGRFIRAFDAFRKKRNVSSYDIGGGISHREVDEMIGIAQSLQQDIEHWIRTNHSSLL